MRARLVLRLVARYSESFCPKSSERCGFLGIGNLQTALTPQDAPPVRHFYDRVRARLAAALSAVSCNLGRGK